MQSQGQQEEVAQADRHIAEAAPQQTDFNTHLMMCARRFGAITVLKCF
jgi:hypothetical protein